MCLRYAMTNRAYAVVMLSKYLFTPHPRNTYFQNQKMKVTQAQRSEAARKDNAKMQQLLEGNAAAMADMKVQAAGNQMEVMEFLRKMQVDFAAEPSRPSPTPAAGEVLDKWTINPKKIRFEWEIDEEEEDEDGEPVKRKVNLGSGSFGVVYKGTYKHTDVAVKQMNIEASADVDLIVAAFKREVALMFDLHHPHIVVCFGGTVMKKAVRIVTELMTTSLSKEIYDKKATFFEPERRLVIVHIARGLSYLHCVHVTHRDLKPDNVMRDQYGIWKLIDFGMASTKSSSKKSSSKTGSNQGTQGYMAPELYTEKGGNHKVDAYAFGVTIWELYARGPLYPGVGDLAIGGMVKAGKRPSLSEMKQPFPPDVQELVVACWHQDPKQRPEMADVVGAIEAGANGGKEEVLKRYRKRLALFLKDGILGVDEKEALQEEFGNGITEAEHITMVRDIKTTAPKQKPTGDVESESSDDDIDDFGFGTEDLKTPCKECGSLEESWALSCSKCGVPTSTMANSGAPPASGAGVGARKMLLLARKTLSPPQPHLQKQLCAAVEAGKVAAVRKLLAEDQANPSVPEENYPTFPPIFLAAQHGYAGVAKVLLEFNADPNQSTTDKFAASPMYIAAHRGHAACLKVLLKYNADINKGELKNEGTPVFYAARNGHLECVKLLLELNAEPNQPRTFDGSAPLFRAAQEGHVHVVKVLLGHSADPNQVKSTTGSSPVYIAAQEGHVDIVRVLLEHNADPNLKRTKSGLSGFLGLKYLTPLSAAKHLSDKQSSQIIQQLLKQYGAK